jgi:AraC family transcriptional regulator
VSTAARINHQDRGKHEDVCEDVAPIPFQHAISDPKILHLIANTHAEVQSGAQVLRLIANMREEVHSGCPGGKMYSEALSLALMSYLLARYPKPVHVECSGLTFSDAQAARLQDFIQANLARDIALSELADLTGFSAHYFSFLFKNTFLVAPHRYLLRERIHESQKLLLSGRLSICEVALKLGFSDQSHFTQVFRKVTGITPRRYQRSCWSEAVTRVAATHRIPLDRDG